MNLESLVLIAIRKGKNITIPLCGGVDYIFGFVSIAPAKVKPVTGRDSSMCAVSVAIAWGRAQAQADIVAQLTGFAQLPARSHG